MLFSADKFNMLLFLRSRLMHLNHSEVMVVVLSMSQHLVNSENACFTVYNRGRVGKLFSFPE